MRSAGLWSAFCVCLLLALCACSGTRMDFDEWDASFESRYSLTSTPLMEQELILGRPFMFKYADSSLFIYDYLGDSLFVLIDLNDHSHSKHLHTIFIRIRINLVLYIEHSS